MHVTIKLFLHESLYKVFFNDFCGIFQKDCGVVNVP